MRGDEHRARSRTRVHAPAIFLVLLALVLPHVVRAQNAGVLSGRIVDTAGAPIGGASVRIPQLERSVPVDSSGRYRIDGLPTGRVTLIGEAPGFNGKRAEVVVPANGGVEQSFSLVPNAHVLANVDVRARAHPQLPLRLHEFEQRRTRATGRFLSPDDLVKFRGRPLVDALKTVMVGARIERNAKGELVIVSSRQLNPGPGRIPGNIKPCGIQIWEDGVLLADPNQSADVIKSGGSRNSAMYVEQLGPGREYDISSLLSDNYMAVEYYTDLASTPPGFRTGSPSCGTLVLWTKMPDSKASSP